MTDPRDSFAVLDNRVTYQCGCVNEVLAPAGLLHSVSKCSHHRAKQRDPVTLGLAYYEELGAIKDGIPQSRHYLDELREALGEFYGAKRDPASVTLEIGCGASMYAAGLINSGFDYIGLDPSPWACAWTSNTFEVPTITGTLDDIATPDSPGNESLYCKSRGEPIDLILAAHCLEHMDDAPKAIQQCADLLNYDGKFWLIVPDDTDPLNPDHQWFFTPDSLRSCLEAAGLVVERLVSRRIVKHENFLYARARKPA